MRDKEKTFVVMMQQNGIDFTAEITQEVIDEMQRLMEKDPSLAERELDLLEMAQANLR